MIRSSWHPPCAPPRGWRGCWPVRCMRNRTTQSGPRGRWQVPLSQSPRGGLARPASPERWPMGSAQLLRSRASSPARHRSTPSTTGGGTTGNTNCGWPKPKPRNWTSNSSLPNCGGKSRRPNSSTWTATRSGRGGRRIPAKQIHKSGAVRLDGLTSFSCLLPGVPAREDDRQASDEVLPIRTRNDRQLHRGEPLGWRASGVARRGAPPSRYRPP